VSTVSWNEPSAGPKRPDAPPATTSAPTPSGPPDSDASTTSSARTDSPKYDATALLDDKTRAAAMRHGWEVTCAAEPGSRTMINVDRTGWRW
jgi:hypothetical protein